MQLSFGVKFLIVCYLDSSFGLKDWYFHSAISSTHIATDPLEPELFHYI